MQDEKALLQRLTEEQVNLFASAAASGTLPPDRVIRRLADLELTISALELQIENARTTRKP